MIVICLLWLLHANQSGWIFHILNNSCHTLNTSRVHVCFCPIHNEFLFWLLLFCLIHCSSGLCFSWHQILYSFCGLDYCFLGLCASTLLDHANTHSLVPSFAFLIIVSSPIISVMISPFMPFTNCSFNLLFLCTHIHLPLFWGISFIPHYWYFIEKPSVKQSMKCKVCSNFQMSFFHLSQMDPPVEASGGQDQYKVRSSWPELRHTSSRGI